MKLFARSVSILVLIVGVTTSASAQTPAVKASSVPPAAAKETDPRERLLILGFDAASAIPESPHAKDRALVQESLGRAAVQVGDTLRAMTIAKEMNGWRSGMVWSELALDAAKSGRADAARTFAKFALNTIGTALQWQQDRVKVRVGQVYAWLGDDAGAAELEKGVGESEQGKVRSSTVARGNGEDFEKQIASAEQAIATRNFDLTVNAFDTCVELAAKSAGDETRWERILALIEKGAGGAPRDIHIKTYLRLADTRVAQGAKDKARELVKRAVVVRDGARWMPESALPLAADIARRLHAVGDNTEARAELDRALSEFEAGKAKVADIFCAGALRPAAEALVIVGDGTRAHAVFAEAIEEGARNPNARPRAMDLAETCAALARSGIPVDDAMWQRLRAIRDGLKDPW